MRAAVARPPSARAGQGRLPRSTRSPAVRRPAFSRPHVATAQLLPLFVCASLQIALIPEEEFRAHPLAAEQKLAEAGTDAHQLMLNRLQHEVAYRWGRGFDILISLRCHALF